jgi:hypothetical protein
MLFDNFPVYQDVESRNDMKVNDRTGKVTYSRICSPESKMLQINYLKY